MRVSEYQDGAKSSAIYPEYSRVMYPLLGLVGEVGELVSKFYDAMWHYSDPVPDGQEQFKDALLAVVTVGRRCETLKKQVRGGDIDLEDRQKTDLMADIELAVGERREELGSETADICWYISAVLTDLKLELEDVLRANLKKLAARKQAGTIHNHKPDSREDKQQ